MNNFENTKKRELIILSLGLAMPLIVMSMILIKEEFKSDEQLLVSEEIKYKKAERFKADINAKSAIVTELNSGNILFALNENEKLPIASITKLMTTLVANKKFQKDNISNIQINENHLTPLGDSGLLVGQIWKVKDLIDFAIMSSSNDAAKALATSAFGEHESNFISDMNLLSREIGLVNTFFINETGLDINLETEAGAISTANDLSKILKYIYENNIDVFESTSQREKVLSNSGLVYNIKNTNDSVDKIPGLLLSKTGYTDLAGGNLAIITDIGINNPVAIIVLGSTIEEREGDVLELYNQTLKHYSNNLK